MPGANEKFGKTFAPINDVTGRATTVGGRIATNRGGGLTGSTRATMGKTTSVRTGTRPVMDDKTNLGPPATANGGGAKVPKAPKRQPWDLKGRLEDMENMFRATQERVGALEKEKTELSTEVEIKQTVVQQSSVELDTIRSQLDQHRKEKADLGNQLDEERDKSKGHLRKIEDLEYTKSSLERKIQGLEGEISTKISEVNGLKSTVAEMGAASAGLEAKLTSTKTQLEDALARVAQLETLSTQQGDMIEAFKAKERGYETERRQLHNTIQELKGNIRVFCRVRPLLDGGVSKHIQLLPSDNKTITLAKTEESHTGRTADTQKNYNFSFDRVFSPQASQKEVFE